MKKLFFSSALFLCMASLSAQECSFPYNSGGFGHFFTGPAYFHPGSLNDYLAQPDVLNTNLSIRPGNMTGGEGLCLLGRFMIGGGGFGETMGRVTTDSARANLSFGGGYFKFGYMCGYKKDNFYYVYGGMGWGGLNLHVENISAETDIRFNHRAPLAPGKKADYNLSCTFYDAGISWKHLFVSKNRVDQDGGFMLGLDIGCSLAIPVNDWQAGDERVVTGPPIAGGMLNPYFRLTIGGGGFSVKEE